MTKKSFFSIVALISIATVIGFSCSKSSSSTPGGTTVTISMHNMEFLPGTDTVAKGTVVKWVNNDPYAHWVISNDAGASFNSGGPIAGGSSFSFTTNATGTIPYHCQIHGLAMSGILVVTP